MSSMTIEIDVRSVDDSDDIIIMRGWLQKQSIHLKQWRKRWAVIVQRDNEYYLETFKKITILNTIKTKPTAVIRIDNDINITHHNFNHDLSGFIITNISTNNTFGFKVHNIYNHKIADWINCIKRIQYLLFNGLQTNNTINRISNNQKLQSNYIYTQNASQCLLYDHWKYICIYYARIHLSGDHDGKLIKIIVSYLDLTQNDNEQKNIGECFKWIRNLSMLQNVNSQRYYTPTIVYDTLSENNGAEKCGHYLQQNMMLSNANYFPFNKTNTDHDIYFSIFRVGAPHICDLIMINRNELRVKNDFNDQDMDIIYHQLPSLNVLNPSVIYHNDHLFAVGGYDKDHPFDQNGLSDIYCLNLKDDDTHWQCITNYCKLKMGKFGSGLSFLTGNMLMIIGGCHKKHFGRAKSVELYEFEGIEYIQNHTLHSESHHI